MKVGIHGKSFTQEESPLIKQVFSTLKEYGAVISVSEPFSSYLNSDFEFDSVFRNRDDLNGHRCVISLGGDGTLLDTLVFVCDSLVPILGINTGRLGYLATTSKENISEALAAIQSGDFIVDDRILLNFESTPMVFDGQNFALNDFTILKKDTSSMIGVDIYVNGEFLNKYWADGLIVSTPTGSTGYSLSCGGPLVLPHAQNFIITPVAPHNLTVRPLVLPDTEELSFKIDARTKHVLVSLDSRSVTIDADTEIKIKKERFTAKLVKIEGYSNFDTLRQKLNWGLDNRN